MKGKIRRLIPALAVLAVLTVAVVTGLVWQGSHPQAALAEDLPELALPPALETPTPTPTPTVRQYNWRDVPTPTPTPTPPPSPTPGSVSPEQEGMADVLAFFFRFWRTGHTEGMLALTSPTWQRTQESPDAALIRLVGNRVPAEDMQIESYTRVMKDVYLVTVQVTLDGADGPARCTLALALRLEDNLWYVDPTWMAESVEADATAAPGVTATLGPIVTPIPSASTEEALAADTLRSFFYFWHVNDLENMLALTVPSWRNAQEEPEAALLARLANHTAGDDLEIVLVTGSAEDALRAVMVRVTINSPTGSSERYAFNVVMCRENAMWYVDPNSIVLNVQTTAAPSATPLPTQPALSASVPAVTLYYNPNGGSYYHIDPNCPSVSTRYLPMTGQFLYSQLNEETYAQLKNCSYCAAPLREN